MKNCTRCLVEKNEDEFYIQKSKWGDRPSSWCKNCICIDRKNFRDSNPGILRKRRKEYRQRNSQVIDARCKEWRKKYFERHPYKQFEYRIKSEYGITAHQFHEMIIEQENKCALCEKYFNHNGTKTNFGIDHCHKTGKVRGLLCYQCNSAIGYVKESTTTLEKMIAYIKKHKAKK